MLAHGRATLMPKTRAKMDDSPMLQRWLCRRRAANAGPAHLDCRSRRRKPIWRETEYGPTDADQARAHVSALVRLGIRQIARGQPSTFPRSELRLTPDRRRLGYS